MTFEKLQFISEIDSVCKTKGCIEVASSVLSSIDSQVKPCDDFYKYACGGWEKNTPIPPGYSYWDRSQELAYKNMYQLHELLGKFFLSVQVIIVLDLYYLLNT